MISTALQTATRSTRPIATTATQTARQTSRQCLINRSNRSSQHVNSSFLHRVLSYNKLASLQCCIRSTVSSSAQLYLAF